MRRFSHLHVGSPIFAWAALLGLLLVASTNLWHHHDDDNTRHAPHSDCTTCVAAALDKTDGLPPPRFAASPLVLLERREVPTWGRAAAPSARRPTARGPPVA